MNLKQIIDSNLQRVREQMAAAAETSGRSLEDITLVAVTKYTDVDSCEALLELGVRDFGESRPQELWRKAAALSDSSIHWHFIGHLQRNKTKKTLPLCSLFHSGDSVRLMQALSAERLEPAAEVLLEVNVSGDEAKHGFTPSQIQDEIHGLIELPNLRVVGLMGMAGLATDAQSARSDFKKLAELRETLRQQLSDDSALPCLSMGMSRDFVAAIEEGATHVRVGSTLFEGVR